MALMRERKIAGLLRRSSVQKIATSDNRCAIKVALTSDISNGAIVASFISIHSGFPMILLLGRWGGFLLPLLLSLAAAVAGETDIWSQSITSAWLDDHVAARRAVRPRPPTGLSRTQVWANGIARTQWQTFAPTDFDRNVGAKVRLFHDYNFLVGTELIRGGGEASRLSSKATWEAFLTRDWDRLGGVTFGLSTMGFVDSIQSGYSQSLSGTMDIPLDLPLSAWSTQVRFSPSMSLDAVNGAVSTGLMSEIIGQTQLTSPADRFRSELNVRLGYGVAPATRPVASATLELRISPNL